MKKYGGPCTSQAKPSKVILYSLLKVSCWIPFLKWLKVAFPIANVCRLGWTQSNIKRTLDRHYHLSTNFQSTCVHADLAKNLGWQKVILKRTFLQEFNSSPCPNQLRSKIWVIFCGCGHFTAKYFSKWIILNPLNYSYFVSSRHFWYFLFLFGSNVCPQISKTSLN